MALVALMLVLGTMSGPVAMAQDATEEPETPDVIVPGTGDDGDGGSSPEAQAEETPEPEETPADDEPAGDPVTVADSQPTLSATDPGHPAVLAHGLAYNSGDRSVWEAREFEPSSSASATGETTNAAIVYQVEGSTIVRNEVTGKRALLNPGESYFKAAGDPYTMIANSNDSLVWVFELVGPSDVDDDAFYESPLIETYDEGVFDLYLARYVLDPGESAELPEHTGPALVISASGDIDIESSEGIGLLATADGQLVRSDATVVNNSQEPVVFLLVAYGETVDDATSGPGTGPSTTPVAADDATDSGETTTTDDDTDVAPPEDTDETNTQDPPVGGNQESINVTATAELYLVVVADGVTVFDGPIPAGGQSGVIVGSSFEVYTSNGGATVFTNSCGEEFQMGYETGEARYTLEADGVSCLG